MTDWYELIKPWAPILLFILFPQLRRQYGLYRQRKAQGPAARQSTRSTPLGVQYAIGILSVAIVAALIANLYLPENIFTITSSRIHTHVNVIFRRLAATRPGGRLTESDESLRRSLDKFEDLCIYLAYGPDVVANCPYCTYESSSSYFYYVLPSVLLPHLLNIAALGLATSRAIAGREGARWRYHAIFMGGVLAACNVIVLHKFDWRRNAAAVRAEDIISFYWLEQIWRNRTLAITNAGFAAFLWATSTNRILVMPPSAAERVDAVLKVMENNLRRTDGLAIAQGAAARNPELRERHNSYWAQEEEKMRRVMTEPGVVDAINTAVKAGKLDLEKLGSNAQDFVDKLFPPVAAEQANNTG